MKSHSQAKDPRKRFDCLLVNPPLCSDGCYEKTTVPLIPTHLVALATTLRKHGFHANILDLAILDDALEIFEQMLDDLRPKIVGLSNHTVINLDIIEKLALIAKQYDATVVLGGVNPTHMKNEVFDFVPSSDNIFLGFSEASLLDFLCGKNQGRIITATESDFSRCGRDISILPFKEHYLGALYPIEAQRGCEFNCTFCTSKMTLGKKPARRPIERIIEEIKTACKIGFTEFFVTDNTFTGNAQYAKQLSSAIKEAKTGANFIGMTRLDCLSRDLLDCLKAAGFNSLGFGFESISPEVLHRYAKKMDHEKTERILSEIAEDGIETTAFIMVGGPDDTGETLATTYEALTNLIQKCLLNWVTCSMFRPFPGTAYWKSPEKFGLEFEKTVEAFHDWGFFNGKAITATSHLSKERIEFWATEFNGLNSDTPKLQI